MSAREVILEIYNMIAPYIVFGAINHLLVTAFSFLTTDRDGDKRTGFWGVVRTILIVPMGLMYLVDIIFFSITVNLFDTLKNFERTNPGMFKSENKDKTKEYIETQNKIYELEKELESKKDTIKSMNEQKWKEREQVSEWLEQKNDLIERLTNRVQELENQMGIDSGFDEEREERIRKLVMEKIHGKGAE